MKRTSGHLLRFIDLGLLLLLAFLSVAELNPTIQVPLPGKPGASPEKAIARVEFNQKWNGVVTHLNHGTKLCQPSRIAEFFSCMERHSELRFVLAPREAAKVQQVVILLDVCKAFSLMCTIEPQLP